MGKVVISRIRNKNYSVICNQIFMEKEISLKAKGLYAMVMSLPDDWDFSLKGICTLNKENYTAVNNAIKELIDAGYCSRKQISDGGRFAGYEYQFFEEKSDVPCSGFLNTENLNINKYNSINNNTNNTKGIKRISNDIHKEQKIEFIDFYKLYPLKKAKQIAERAWNKLSAKDQKEAIDKLSAYISDCALNRRSFKHPATYLNQRTWEDDFGIKDKIAFYDIQPTDSDKEKQYKEWMRKNYPDIENTALPLSYDDFVKLRKDYGQEDLLNALELMYKEIYRYRRMDIANVLKFFLTDEEDEL